MRSTLALLASLLAVAPEPAQGSEDDAVVDAQPELDDSEQGRYLRAVQQLEEAVTLGDVQPKQAIVVLGPAIEQLQLFPALLANDIDTLRLRAEAHVSLARAYLVVRDDAKASEALLEGIRSAPFGEQLPAKKYGPKVERLFKKQVERARAAARQDIEVKCWVKCRVYLNERVVAGMVESDANEATQGGSFAMRGVLSELTTGSYRLRVEAEDGAEVPLSEVFEAPELESDSFVFVFGTKPKLEDEQATVVAEGPEPAPGTEPGVAGDGPEESPPPKSGRALPRPVEITMIVAGVGLIASGAVLFSLNGECASDRTVADALPADGNVVCPSLWRTAIGGVAMMGAGGAFAAAGSVLLGVDEVRGPRGQTATRFNIGWRARF